MPVRVIATSPISLNVLNTVEVRSGFRASSRLVAPARRFDTMVKNAKVLNPRATPLWKCPGVWTAV
jgi:hypothetical protein